MDCIARDEDKGIYGYNFLTGGGQWTLEIQECGGKGWGCHKGEGRTEGEEEEHRGGVVSA